MTIHWVSEKLKSIPLVYGFDEAISMRYHKCMSRLDRIRSLIQDNFEVHALDIQDESHRHAGHQGHSGGDHTHLRIICNATELSAMSRVNAHRALNGLLKAEFESGLHAVSYELNG